MWLAVTALLLAPHLRTALVPTTGSHPDGRVLADLGWPRPLWQWELLRGAAVIAALAVGRAIGLPEPIAIIAGVVAPSVAARLRAETASRRSRVAMTRLLRGAEATLRIGGALPEALRRAVDASADDIARRPFAEALRTFDLGSALDDALRRAAARSRDDRARIALETLAIGVTSRLAGDRAAVLLAAVADRLAFEERVDEEVRARTGGLRVQVVLLAALVPAMALYLAMTVPSLGQTLSSPIGRLVLIPAAAALEVAGLVASRGAVNAVGR